MVLHRLEFAGFRNLKEAELNFAPDRNLIFGENGSGKTNLLEAVYCLGMGRSFRKASDIELLQFGAQFYRLEGEGPKKVVLYYSNHTKKIILNGCEITRLADFIGWMPMVIFSLEDIWLIRGEPRERRNFLDLAIAKISRSYLNNLIEYRRVVKQRNRMLENLINKSAVLDDQVVRLMTSFDESLVRYGNEVYEGRRTYFDYLSQQIARFCNEMDLKDIEVTYKSSVPDMKLSLEHLLKNRDREINLGQTIFGPHRDDIVLRKAGKDLRIYGSEGEQRITALALRQAEAGLVEKELKETSIKLVDEVLVELDSRRQDFFLRSLQGQVLFATTRPFSHFGKNFLVDNGSIQETS